jgi:hypothetical protein
MTRRSPRRPDHATPHSRERDWQIAGAPDRTQKLPSTVDSSGIGVGPDASIDRGGVLAIE